MVEGALYRLPKSGYLL